MRFKFGLLIIGIASAEAIAEDFELPLRRLGQGSIPVAKSLLIAMDQNGFQSVRIPKPAAVTSNDRGEAQRQKGELDVAIQSYSEAIQLDPLFPWPYNNRGLAWAAKGETDKALNDYAEAIRLDPT